MLQKKIVLTLAALAVLPVATRSAYAETFTISANGDNSSSSVNVSQSQSNGVTQTNTAEVQNNVNVDANTGNNSASSNTGGSNAIDAGNATTNVDVQNQMNQSIADSSLCCNSGDNSGAIIGNGADSNNGISYSSNNSNNVHVSQYANITNNISGTINTGGNSASHNSGNVSIDTGSISVSESVKNTTNTSKVVLGTGGNQGFSLKIAGNGAGSLNTITLNQDTNTSVVVSNVADIFNHSVWNLITGNNKADGNNGNVAIKTGDITVKVAIDNNANTSDVTVDCDCETPPPPPPPCDGDGCNPPPPPPPPPGNGGGGGSSSGGGGSNNPSSGSVLGTTTGQVLPATGNPWILLAILGNLLMLFFGVLLRLRSGRSPGAFAL